MNTAVILSTFEGGYQPMTAISAASALELAGLNVKLVDTYVEGVETALHVIADKDFVAIAIPLFDSLTSGIELSRQIRKVNKKAKIIFFGQYASINVERLTGKHCDYTIFGEWERPLVSLAKSGFAEPSSETATAIFDLSRLKTGAVGKPALTRDHFVLPNRSLAPALEKYPQPHLERLLGRKLHVGGLEATRGCHHKCSYCSVYAAYDGKVLLVPEELILKDIETLVNQGMDHLTFTDADFFNAKAHNTKILKAAHAKFAGLTFDITTRVDHILENKEVLTALAQCGLTLITSALEFPNQKVLDEISKEMTIDMIEESIEFLHSAGIQLNPTFIMFNPWIGLSDLVMFHDFVERTGLKGNIDPIQFETRLHLYKGSPLLDNSSIRKLELEEAEFHFNWKHPDPEVDALYLSMLNPVVDGGFKRCCLKC